MSATRAPDESGSAQRNCFTGTEVFAAGAEYAVGLHSACSKYGTCIAFVAPVRQQLWRVAEWLERKTRNSVRVAVAKAVAARVAAAPPEVVVEWEEADKVAAVVEDLAAVAVRVAVVEQDLAAVVAKAAVVVEDLAVVVAKAVVVAEDQEAVVAKAVVARAVEAREVEVVVEDLAAARAEVWAAAAGQVVEWVAAEAADLAAVVVRVAEPAGVSTPSSKGRRFRAAPFF